ncbi:unnamed protein product, partial [Candidula unifasciata]
MSFPNIFFFFWSIFMPDYLYTIFAKNCFFFPVTDFPVFQSIINVFIAFAIYFFQLPLATISPTPSPPSLQAC